MNRTDPRKVVPAVVLIVLAAVAIGVFARLGFDDKRDTPVEQVASGAYDQSAANATVMGGRSQGEPTADAKPGKRLEDRTQGRAAPDNAGDT
jgi:hypothetical protein